jgi:hypothetical protein
MISRKLSNRRARAIDVRVQVESAAIEPSVSGENTRRNKLEMILETCPCIGKQPLENPVHREDGGTGVDRGITHAHLAHLSAWSGGFFEYADAESSMCEISRRGEPAYARADDRDVMSLVTHRNL